MRRKTLLAFVAVAAIAAVPSAQAHSRPSSTGWTTVASGLDNPRGIAVAKNGDIWVAEAGRGGTLACQPGEEGGTSCFGATGALTLIHNGVQKRVVTGLPSFADQTTGDSALGASDIIANGSHVTALIGVGGNPAARTAAAAADPSGALFGWMVKVDPWKGTVKPFVDLLQYEATANPDKGDVDSDIYGLAERPGGFVVADAAGNDVLGVDFRKHVSTLAVFPDVQVLAPPFLQLPVGAMIPMQAVPTTVAVRPKDPNVYVGQLTGFPFVPGAANVYRVAPDGTVDTYATGFTNIVDIAWGKKGSLYVLEIAKNGLASSDPATGSLIRVWPNGQQTEVASAGLVNPTGVAIARDGTVYVTNYGTSAGKGTVLNLGKV